MAVRPYHRVSSFPRLYEGFGLPVLEAMASGGCVVVRNASAMAEIAGEAGALVETADPDALAATISGASGCARAASATRCGSAPASRRLHHRADGPADLRELLRGARWSRAIQTSTGMTLNPTDRLRHLLRRNRYYVTMRRIQREGPLVALRRRMLWARILDTAPVRMEPTNENAAAEVHLLCSRRDYLCAIWALKSFYCFSGMTCPLAIHLQGQSPERMVARMRQHFPDARIVLQAEADAFVEPELERAGFDRLLALRRKTPFMLKLTDFVLMCRAPRLLLLDSDVLFFAHARDLVEQARSASQHGLVSARCRQHV